MADANKWKSSLDTGAVTVIPPTQARKVDPKHIFTRPSRKVRTDKNQGGGDLRVKSRLVLLGDGTFVVDVELRCKRCVPHK